MENRILTHFDEYIIKKIDPRINENEHVYYA